MSAPDLTSMGNDHHTLRLIWPQWQGAGRDIVGELLPEVPLGEARRAYALGAQVLAAVLPAHDGPTEVVAIPDSEHGATDGIESRQEIIASLASAQMTIARYDFDRVLTLGGECSVSVAPFAALADKYGKDLAVVWIDSHPDTDTPDTGYDGYHAMAVSQLLGRGDKEIVSMLPATVAASHVALAGLQGGEEDALAHVVEWGLQTFSPEELRESSEHLLAWLAGTGATKVAIHLDVDTIDSNDAFLGLAPVPGGLTRADVRRIIAELGEAVDVVGLTIAEFIPRDVLAVRGLLTDLPLLASDSGGQTVASPAR